jgi:hypothetical protein
LKRFVTDCGTNSTGSRFLIRVVRHSNVPALFSKDIQRSAVDPCARRQVNGTRLTGLAGLLGFDLLPGTTLEQAHEVAALMNAKISAVTITT